MVPDRFDPVLDRIETWESDRTILPGIDVRLAPGHTPGSSVIVVSSGSEKALLLGDIVHCPLELMDDDFNLLADYDQELANRARRAYAQELEGTDIPVSAAHFPGLRFGRLLPGEGVQAMVVRRLTRRRPPWADAARTRAAGRGPVLTCKATLA